MLSSLSHENLNRGSQVEKGPELGWENGAPGRRSERGGEGGGREGSKNIQERPKQTLEMLGLEQSPLVVGGREDPSPP